MQYLRYEERQQVRDVGAGDEEEKDWTRPARHQAGICETQDEAYPSTSQDDLRLPDEMRLRICGEGDRLRGRVKNDLLAFRQKFDWGRA